MAISVYYIPFPGQANTATRMTALLASVAPNEIPKPRPDPTRGTLLLHSLALGQDAIYHDDGTLTTASYLSDPIYAADIPEANQHTIQAHLAADLVTIEAWLSANPNGAVLTAAQTKVLARMLAGLTRIIAANTASIGQA